MLLCHPVNILAEVHGQKCHVQLILSCQFLQHIEWDHLSNDLPDQVVGKFIMSCLDRGMGGKDTDILYLLGVPYGPFIPYGLNILFITGQEFNGQEARMPLVHVVLLYMEAEGLEHPHPANPEQQLLLQPVALITAVKGICKLPVLLGILRDIRIKEKDRDAAAGQTAYIILPYLDAYLPPFNAHPYPLGKKHHMISRVPYYRVLYLFASGIYLLHEVPFPVYQGYRNHWKFKVCRRFYGVSR